MRLLITSLFILLSFLAKAQTRADNENIQLIFWNVENLFDTEDDSLTRDDEYLPYSMRGWNHKRYEQKLFSIYKTLVAVGGWQLPELIALAEIENRTVLEDLLSKTPLLRAGYQIIHQESEDRRGIDLAVLYRPEHLQVVDTSFIGIRFPDAPDSRTRDVLYLKGRVSGIHDFHLFVNHWPSRYGGGRSSESRRMHVAGVVRNQLNEIYKQDSLANCIVLGDFNDAPEDASLQELASAHVDLQLVSSNSFQGTHKFQGIWSHFDQIWVSRTLLENETLWLTNGDATIFHPDWLLKNDKTYGGLKPNRTYEGFRYHGGYSDHLPIYLELSSGQSQLADKEK